MFKSKSLISILLVALVAFAQFGTAYAADPAQTATSITGAIQSITLQTDATGTTTVVVTVLDSTGATQTVTLSLDSAVSLGLVTVDPTTGVPTVNSTQVGQTVSIDSSLIIPATDGPQNPVAGALAFFFGVDNATINGYHTDGFGYGLIAQALWMSKLLNGDATLAGDILAAKKSGDYSAFALPDGSTPTNWGQFLKAVFTGQAKDNLGSVMSGKSTDAGSTTNTTGPGQSGQPHGNGGGNGNGNGKGNGHGKP
jgi:hypothetical protein